MGCDIFGLSKCCFCLPLRYGLLGFGYIKLVGLVVMLYFMCDYLHYVVSSVPEYYVGMRIYSLLLILLLILDATLCVLHLVGAHKKNYRFLKPYYIYNFSLAAIILLVYGTYYGIDLNNYLNMKEKNEDIKNAVYLYMLDSFLRDLGICITFVLLQIYYAFLIRCEYLKLRDDEKLFAGAVEDQTDDNDANCVLQKVRIPYVTLKGTADDERSIIGRMENA